MKHNSPAKPLAWLLTILFVTFGMGYLILSEWGSSCGTDDNPLPCAQSADLSSSSNIEELPHR
jgi:hypothetical protein